LNSATVSEFFLDRLFYYYLSDLKINVVCYPLIHPLHPNQEIATARDINLLRAINFLEGKPIAKTRIPRLVKLAH
jgi:hypothetical protein